MKNNHLAVYIILLLCFPIFIAAKSADIVGSQKVIRVAALIDPPFVSYDFEHNLSGLATDIFKQAAIKNNWQYKFYPVEGDVYSLIADVKNNKYDILIGPISVDYARIKEVSYTRPFYLSQMKLAIYRQSASPLKAVLDVFYSIPIEFLIVIFFLLLLIVHVIWLSERNKNPDMPKKYVHGILFSCWVFIAHFFKGGLLYRPVTNTARLMLVIWLIIALCVFLIATSTYTAYVTARLVDSKQAIDSINELKGVKIAYVQGQAYESFPEKVGAIGIPVSSMKQGLQMVQDRQVFGVLGGQLILASEIDTFQSPDVVISTIQLTNDEYAFALPVGSPYIRPIDLTIVEMQDNGEMTSICEAHLGENYTNCDF